MENVIEGKTRTFMNTGSWKKRTEGANPTPDYKRVEKVKQNEFYF